LGRLSLSRSSSAHVFTLPWSQSRLCSLDLIAVIFFLSWFPFSILCAVSSGFAGVVAPSLRRRSRMRVVSAAASSLHARFRFFVNMTLPSVFFG